MKLAIAGAYKLAVRALKVQRLLGSTTVVPVGVVGKLRKFTLGFE